MRSVKIATLFLGIVGIFTHILGAFSYPGCADVTANDFELEKLFDKATGPTWEPVKMAFSTDATGNVDVYFIELRDAAKTLASIKVYKGATKTVVNLISFTVAGGGNDGLAGLAMDPNFKTNGWLYVQYSIGTVFRLSRFTVQGNTIAPSSEVAILEIPSTRSQYHTGGAMQFDAYGDLWWGVGDNMAAELGPSNTADLRGKIVRIHPIAIAEGQKPAMGIGSTYTIPKGNYGEYFAAKYTAEGNAARAAEFADLSKVRPEIYASGARNPYTLTLDPVRRWVTWGDCGPDHGAVTEEHNLTTVPGHFGYPHFAGNNWTRPDYLGTDPKAPLNKNANAKGVKILPPATPAIRSYQQDCAMTGPIYRYNSNLQSSIKLPQHFDGWWLIADFNKDWIYGYKLSEDGTKLIDSNKFTDAGGIFANIKPKLYDPLDVQTGPDGALYVLNYNGWYNSGANTSIVRIKYIGKPCNVVPVNTHVATKSLNATFDQSDLLINGTGNIFVSIYDVSGQEMYRSIHHDGDKISMEKIKTSAHGLMIINVSQGNGQQILKYHGLRQ